MTTEEVNKIENNLREIEKIVEAQGRRICSIPGKGNDWNFCNKYIAKVDDLIHSAYNFNWMDEEN